MQLPDEFEAFLAELLDQHRLPDVTEVTRLSTQPTMYAYRSRGVRVRADDKSAVTVYIQRSDRPNDDHQWPGVTNQGVNKS